MHDISNYERLRKDAQNFYHNVRPILSPALDEYVHFTAESFNHIVFKSARRGREKTSQTMRFKLLPRAVKLIECSTTYQEFEQTLKEFEVKSHKKRIRKTKPVTYWGIIAIVDGRKIKVILKKVGDNGQLHFWSIVPDWTATVVLSPPTHDLNIHPCLYYTNGNRSEIF